METGRTNANFERRVLTVVPVVGLFVVAAATAAILIGTAILRPAPPAIRTASAAVAVTTHMSFDILPVRPGGPADSWPAYMANGPTALPADADVTVTIRNFDVGDDALPAGSPFLRVQGTLGAATADGKAYTALAADRVSHTFTVPQLQLNVPIPGDPVGDATYVGVTFRFHTPAKAGTYTFQCFVPCGTGASGFDGPMATMGYMHGTFTVVA